MNVKKFENNEKNNFHKFPNISVYFLFGLQEKQILTSKIAHKVPQAANNNLFRF